MSKDNCTTHFACDCHQAKMDKLLDYIAKQKRLIDIIELILCTTDRTEAYKLAAEAKLIRKELEE